MEHAGSLESLESTLASWVLSWNFPRVNPYLDIRTLKAWTNCFITLLSKIYVEKAENPGEKREKIVD